MIATPKAAERMALVEKLLGEHELCVSHISDLAKIPHSTLIAYVKNMRDEGRIYVARYEEGRGCVTAYYRAGCEEDAPLPAGFVRRWKAPQVKPAIEVRRDSLVAAFFGASA